jgi:hypothetical protein
MSFRITFCNLFASNFVKTLMDEFSKEMGL